MTLTPASCPLTLAAAIKYMDLVFKNEKEDEEERSLLIQPHRLSYNQVVVNVHIKLYYIRSFTRLVPGDLKALYLKLTGRILHNMYFAHRQSSYFSMHQYTCEY